MSAPRFRVYWGPDDQSEPASESAASENSVRISLHDLYTTLQDAITRRLAWVQDFEDEEVAVSSDLYQVVLAYRDTQHPNSA